MIDKKIILLVEDDVMVVKMYKRKLEHEGFKINLASNGEEGLLAVEEEKPDLIILDIMMPHMNGMDTLQSLKINKKTKNIPVIILTNLGDRPEDVKKFKDLGAVEYLVKANISLSQLIEKIKQHTK